MFGNSAVGVFYVYVCYFFFFLVFFFFQAEDGIRDRDVTGVRRVPSDLCDSHKRAVHVHPVVPPIHQAEVGDQLVGSTVFLWYCG